MTNTAPSGEAARNAIKMLVAAGYVAEEKANEALCIAHGFDPGPLAPPDPAEARPVMRVEVTGNDVEHRWTSYSEPGAKDLPVGVHYLYAHPSVSEGGAGCMDSDGYQDEGVFCPTCATDHSEAQAQGGGEVDAVATVESWTNGSYWRNYKLTWHSEVDKGAKLYGIAALNAEYTRGRCDGWEAAKAASPSAPVGVEGLIAKWRAEADFSGHGGTKRAYTACADELEQALAQQPAAVDELRREGWAVAVHNDYRLHGEQHTFWLFTKDGRAVKGEGKTDAEALAQVRAEIAALAQQPPAVDGAKPLDDWHEDDGPVVWWKFPVDEPAWIGTPNDSDWPGYHTHWTPHPAMPALAAQPQGGA